MSKKKKKTKKVVTKAITQKSKKKKYRRKFHGVRFVESVLKKHYSKRFKDNAELKNKAKALLSFFKENSDHEKILVRDIRVLMYKKRTPKKKKDVLEKPILPPDWFEKVHFWEWEELADRISKLPLTTPNGNPVKIRVFSKQIFGIGDNLYLEAGTPIENRIYEDFFRDFWTGCNEIVKTYKDDYGEWSTGMEAEDISIVGEDIEIEPRIDNETGEPFWATRLIVINGLGEKIYENIDVTKLGQQRILKKQIEEKKKELSETTDKTEKKEIKEEIKELVKEQKEISSEVEIEKFRIEKEIESKTQVEKEKELTKRLQYEKRLASLDRFFESGKITFEQYESSVEKLDKQYGV